MLLCIALSAQAYTDLSLTVKATLKEDGSADVHEEVTVALNNKDELESFDYYATLGEVPLTEWKRFSDRVGYHFNGPIFKTRILGTRDYTAGSSVGKILIEYLVNTTVAKPEQVGSRTTRYTFTQEFLGFERTRGGEVLIPKGATFILELPQQAVLVKALPDPASRNQSNIAWNGPLAAAWNVQYDIEKPLREEVSDYFENIYSSVLSPANFPATLLVLFLCALSALYLWGRSGKRLS